MNLYLDPSTDARRQVLRLREVVLLQSPEIGRRLFFQEQPMTETPVGRMRFAHQDTLFAEAMAYLALNGSCFDRSTPVPHVSQAGFNRTLIHLENTMLSDYDGERIRFFLHELQRRCHQRDDTDRPPIPPMQKWYEWTLERFVAMCSFVIHESRKTKKSNRTTSLLDEHRRRTQSPSTRAHLRAL